MANKRTKTSGAHANPRRLMTATAEEFARWDTEARKRGLTWSALVRQVLDNVAPPKKDRKVLARISATG